MANEISEKEGEDIIAKLKEATKNRDAKEFARITASLVGKVDLSKMKERIKPEYCFKTIETYMKCENKPFTILTAFQARHSHPKYCLRECGTKCIKTEV